MTSDETTPTPRPSREAVPGSSREGDHNYQKIVLALDPSTRIIECRDGIQWIIQRRDSAPKGEPRWRGIAYCRTRSRLEYRLPEHLAALVNLPQRFEAKPRS